MALSCSTPGPDIGLVRGLLGSVDCNVRGLTVEGYAAFARPDSTFGLALTGLLTLYIGFMGYRLLIGRSPLRIGDLTVSAVKIGVVLALATQWATYQTLVYGLLFDGPEQIARGLLTTVQPAGSIFHGDPFDGLQRAYDELNRAAQAFGASAPPALTPAPAIAGAPLVTAAQATAAQTTGTALAGLSLGASALIMLLSSLGALLAAKVVTGLLLALGPLFIALFLFEQTRGLFEGWLRATLAFALVPLAATLFLAVQLTVMEPNLILIHDMRVSGRFDLAPVNAVLVLTLVFAAVSIAGAAAFGIVGRGLRLPLARRAGSAPTSVAASEAAALVVASAAARPTWSEPALAAPSRASAIAAAAGAMAQRDGVSAAVAAASAPEPSTRIAALPGRSDPTLDARPLGRSFPRRASPGPSAAAARRNR